MKKAEKSQWSRLQKTLRKQVQLTTIQYMLQYNILQYIVKQNNNKAR